MTEYNLTERVHEEFSAPEHDDWYLIEDSAEMIAWEHTESGAVVRLTQEKPAGEDLPFRVLLDARSLEEETQVGESDWVGAALDTVTTVFSVYSAGHADAIIQR